MIACSVGKALLQSSDDLKKLDNAAGLSDRSVRYVHATLRAALEDAVREDLVPAQRGEARPAVDT